MLHGMCLAVSTVTSPALTKDKLPRLLLPKQHGQALAHLIGSLVRECHRRDLSRLDTVASDEMRNAACENPRLPRTWPRKYLERDFWWRCDG